MGEKDAHVLDGGDQVVLDLLPPEPSPARPFEVMVVSRIGKTRFHELLPAPSIPARGPTVRLASCQIKGRLLFVSVQSASRLCSGALGTQRTGGAGASARLILHRVADRMDPARS